ncbi:hypothetical protein JCM16303_000236 [Sporobolomyces ruberrimus]
MTLSADELDPNDSSTITTTLEPLLLLVDSIISQFSSSSSSSSLSTADLSYLGAWRKKARRTLKSKLPFIGTYRRDVPPLHELAEYTFPRTEYEEFEGCLEELREEVGRGMYQVPSQLPYIGLGRVRDPITNELEPSRPSSTYSPIMIRLCLAQKTQFLFEQLCHTFNRSPTLKDYLDHPFRKFSLELGKVLEEEWMYLAGEFEDDGTDQLRAAQKTILEEVDKLTWEEVKSFTIAEDEDEREEMGDAGSEWNSAGNAFTRILRRSIERVQTDETRSQPQLENGLAVDDPSAQLGLRQLWFYQ